jgi:cysteine desulfurase
VIYLDYNASTPLRDEVSAALSASLSRLGAFPGNPSSVHRGGRDLRTRLDRARATVARILQCEPREVCFTASGSEADALALKGAFFARSDRSRCRIVTSQIEHPAVLLSLKQLEAQGAEIVRVPPDSSGRVPANQIISELTPKTLLCSLMWANNETGVLQPVEEVARACRARGIPFHVDAVQAAGKVPISLNAVDADLLSISAHKFYGPPGVGALMVRHRLSIDSLVPGHQESGWRGGTQNLPYIEALALALELAARDLESEMERLAKLRDRFENEVRRRIGDVRVNGSNAARVPNTSNIEFAGSDGEAILIALDLEGICVSSGAACASGSLTPSHVLTAMGLSSSQAHGSLRFSFGLGSTDEQVDQVLEALCRHVPKARIAA